MIEVCAQLLFFILLCHTHSTAVCLYDVSHWPAAEYKSTNSSDAGRMLRSNDIHCVWRSLRFVFFGYDHHPINVAMLL
jgi:hypothetical protein